jgi:hypothetical protein
MTENDYSVVADLARIRTMNDISRHLFLKNADYTTIRCALATVEARLERMVEKLMNQDVIALEQEES